MNRFVVALVVSLSAVVACARAEEQSPPIIPPPDGVTPQVRFEPLARGLEHPVYLADDGAGQLFITEQSGKVRLMKNGKLDAKPYYLDLQDRVIHQGEMGLLCVLFHPDFAKNGLLYANYVTRKPTRRTVVAEYNVDPASDHVDAASERIIITIDQPYPNHNGGQLQFGPDGMLYVILGDGGSHDDPKNAAQNPQSLLGKLLRIDVNQRGTGEPASAGVNYNIPKDNPWADGKQVRPEVFALGLRNAWRFSFDRETHEIWAGDVGQNLWEEIDIITKGGNYGWRPREGFHANPNLKQPEQPISNAIDPILEYVHDEKMNKSITGGYVYRGKAIPALIGWYVYADYVSGRVWALKYEKGKVTANVMLHDFDTRLTPSSFGEDRDGELYLCSQEPGVVHKIMGK